MPIPRHSVALSSVQLPVVAECDGVTELRVHGVGGTPPDAILGDLAPEQVSGDAIAGFYRSSDHRAGDGDRDARLDVDRHVEVYSWGGLTSQSKVRVLWLALLPFLFANLAGWMCSARTRNSTWRFRLHRLAAGLGGLALTVNAALIAVMISADVVAYQTVRAGLARHQWWLAPLGWHFVAGHPARQVMLGVLVPVLFVLALVWLASKTWRYEAVRPPYQVTAKRKEKPRRNHGSRAQGRPGRQRILGRRGQRQAGHLAASRRGRGIPGDRARCHHQSAYRITACHRPRVDRDRPGRSHGRPRGRLRLPGRFRRRDR